MHTNRRAALAGLALAGFATAAHAQANRDGPDMVSLMNAVESLRAAMLTKDAKAFDDLSAKELSYGHSAGRIETKQEFIADATSDRSRWVDLAFNDRKLSLAGNNAVARFMLIGKTEAKDGKQTDVKIGVLTVWTRNAGSWQLLARQAFRI